MSKVTVITDATGNIVVIGLGHLSEQVVRASGAQEWVALRAGEGQQLRELDVLEDLEPIGTWSELHSKVAPHIK